MNGAPDSLEVGVRGTLSRPSGRQTKVPAWPEERDLLEKIKTAPEGEMTPAPIDVLPGPKLLLRAYASAVAEVNPLTWSLALEWALSNKAR